MDVNTDGDPPDVTLLSESEGGADLAEESPAVAEPTMSVVCPAAAPTVAVAEPSTELSGSKVRVSRQDKRAREDGIYADYKQAKGAGGNAIMLVMRKHGFRDTQRSTFMGIVKRAGQRVTVDVLWYSRCL